MRKEFKLLFDLHEQLKSVQLQLDCGIIDAVDADSEIMQIKKKEQKLREKLVLERHKNKDGTPKKITYHEPTKDYPNGYYYTKISDSFKPKRATYDLLIDALFDHYGIRIEGNSIASMWTLAIEEKRKISTQTEETFECKDNYYKRYITPEFAKRDIRTVTGIDMQAYTKTLVTTNTLTVHNYNDYKGVLNVIFDFAVRHEIIGINPVASIDNAEYRKMCTSSSAHAEEKILSLEEIDILQKAIAKRNTDNRYHGYYVFGYMIRLAIETGMRAAELCSLHWSDIKEDDTIHIHTQQRELKHPLRYVEIGWTKDERGQSKGGRYFPVTDKIKDILDELKENQKQIGVSSDYVFCTSDGSWIYKRYYEKALSTLCTACNLPKTNNHALRMALNSNVFIPLGVPVTERARLLGHSVETNLKYYSFERKDYVYRAKDLLNGVQKTSEPLPNPKNMIFFEKKKNREACKYAVL